MGASDWTALCRDPFFLVLLRPLRREPCPGVVTAAVGTNTDLKGRLCRGSPSEMLLWEDTEEVDTIHVASGPGLRGSGKLDVFLKMGMTQFLGKMPMRPVSKDTPLSQPSWHFPRTLTPSPFCSTSSSGPWAE